MQKIILAFDTFKGSMSSDEIIETLSHAIRLNYRNACIYSFPVADGGEGTSKIIGRALDAEEVKCKVHNPRMDIIEASYMCTSDHVAIIEMASAAGLPLLKPAERNPLYTTTLGVGEMIVDALERGCKRFILGLGGSATNDAGIGALKALGIRFLDKDGTELIPEGANLAKVHLIDTSEVHPLLDKATFEIACDVTNPFYGPEGAAYVYALQKGATPSQVGLLDDGLRHYAQVLERQLGIDVSQIQGAGAAGGMGGGLLPFLHANLQSGINIVLKTLRFEDVVKDADIIITGEGKIDAQTGMGKALSGILSIANKHRIPVVALAGGVDQVTQLNAMGFTAVFSIQQGPIDLETAMQKEVALTNLASTVIQVLRLYNAH